MQRSLSILALVLAGCTSVKVVQRDGCWVKQTEKFPSGVDEQLGFCSRPAPQWSQDRAARLVQECMSQADSRWENRALAAWSRGQPIPDAADGKTAETCMKEVSASLGLEAENAGLKERLADLTEQREALRRTTDQDRAFLEKSHENVVTALGEAAKRPPPSAVATATSTGTAKSESEPLPATTLVEVNSATLPRAPARAASPTRARTSAPAACSPARPKRRMACAPALTPATDQEPQALRAGAAPVLNSPRSQ